MESKAKLLGHSIHQMLIVFPLGLLATAVIFDVIHLLGGGPTMVAVAYWMMAAGIVGALVAAPFGTIDWLAIPAGTRAKRIGALHGGGNLLVTLLFLGSWLLRPDDATAPSGLALTLSFAGRRCRCSPPGWAASSWHGSASVSTTMRTCRRRARWTHSGARPALPEDAISVAAEQGASAAE